MTDLERYKLIQQRLNYYSCYVKRLLASICEDFDEDSIHGSRILHVINRLMQREDPTFLSFFNGDKTKGLQLIHYLERSGEIIHKHNGYYSLPSIRTVHFESGNQYNVSVLSNKMDNHFGLAALNQLETSIILNVDDYFYRPTLEELVEQLVDNFQLISNLVPTKIFRIRGNKLQSIEKSNILHNNELVILQVDQVRYFAKYHYKKWFAIKLNSEYKRLLIALYHMNDFNIEGEIRKLSEDDILLILDKSLPQEEHALLALIALPEVQQNAKMYVFKQQVLSDVKEILARCNVLIKERT